MSTAQLTNQLQTFFKTDQFEISQLSGGASSRKYYQLSFEEKLYFPESQIVLMTIPVKEIKTLTDYMHIDFYLTRMGVPTPKVYEMKRQFGWIFLEYQNVPTLDAYLKEKPERVADVLAELIDLLIYMQERCQFEENCPAFQRFFDAEKYRFEFEFHVQEQLLSNYFKHDLSDTELQAFNSFSTEISETLDMKAKVFVHRDFQSSNIFYDETGHDIPFKMIDFQDARAGSPIYDLVSCLWDSYIPIPEDVRESLLEKFFDHLAKASTPLANNKFRKLVDYTVIQRKLHDAGAFAYNFHRTNDARFTNFIQPAIQMALEKMREYNSFKDIVNIFEKQRKD